MSKESFVRKFRPTTLSDIHGHPSAIESIEKWAATWEKGDDPLLLHGPAGTGKTTTVEALSNDYGWDLVEINASSARKKDEIYSLAQQIRSSSMDSQRTLFLLDEVDSISGRSLGPLRKVLDDCPNPIIMTCNEKWKVPDSLSNRATLHKFNLQKRSIKPVLRNIAQEEDIDISSRQLGQLSTRQGLRDAINDLQSFAERDGDTDWDDRDLDDSPFSVTEKMLRNKDYIGDMNPDDMVDFLDENLIGEFEGVELMRAFQCLSEADKWNQKVNEKQDYSMWKYSGAIAEEVSDIRLTEPYDGWMNINYPRSRRNRIPHPTDQNSEASLYREIKDMDKPNYRISMNFREFRKEVLPILQSLDDSEKYQLILSHSLSPDTYDALGTTKSKYEDWLMNQEEKSEHQTLDNFTDESESSGEEDEEERSLFDF